jgi:hypothetical protein
MRRNCDGLGHSFPSTVGALSAAAMAAGVATAATNTHPTAHRIGLSISMPFGRVKAPQGGAVGARRGPHAAPRQGQPMRVRSTENQTYLAQMLYGRRTLSFRDFGLGSVLARGGQDRKA